MTRWAVNWTSVICGRSFKILCFSTESAPTSRTPLSCLRLDFLTVDRANIKTESYWQPDRLADTRYQDESEYIEHFLALLTEAVNCRLRNAYATSGHLSGGLDSSIVSVVAQRLLQSHGQILHAFSWSPPLKALDMRPVDERSNILEICQAEGMSPHFTLISIEDMREQFELDVTLQPSVMLYWERAVSRNAKALNCRVMLSGWGGDEFAGFNGRGYFAELFRRGHWYTMTRELGRRSILHDERFWVALRYRVLWPLMPDRIAKLRPQYATYGFGAASWDTLTEQLRAQLKCVESYAQPLLRERPGVKRNQLELLNLGHLAQRMESWAENGAGQGIEYRYPLLDRRVIEFSLSIPGWLFQKQGWKRYMLRQAATGMLPRQVQWAKVKADPAKWAMTEAMQKGHLKTRLQSFKCREQMIRKFGLLDYDRIEPLLGANRNGRDPGVDKQIVPYWLAFVTTPQSFNPV